MIAKRDISQIRLAGVHRDTGLAEYVQIWGIESNIIDDLLQRSDANSEEKAHPR